MLGSFYNVVGLRLPQKASIIRPRSHCPKCQRTLSALELIPVFSYLFLKGKCKGCSAKVSILYPIIESITAGLFLLSYFHWGLSSELIVSLLFVSMLVIITVSDLSSFLILNKVLLFFFVPLLFFRITFAQFDPWWLTIAGMLTGFGLLFLIAVISRGGMGGGDVKLYAVIGIVLGFKGVFMSLFLASMIGAIAGGVGLLTKRLNRKSALPFGPSIAAASIIVYFYGDRIWQWYLYLF